MNTDTARTLDETIAAVRQTLVQLARWGCRELQASDQTLARIENWSRPVHPSTAPETLAQIRNDLGECRRCSLSLGRKRIVFGEGHPGARLVFVGEGPGFEEDQSGRPFVGPAGQLLSRIIAAMHLSREQVYICNVVKCRPPGNRNPAPEEIRTCLPFLKRQLAAIRPAVICTMGNVAAQTLLDTTTPVSRIRGRFHDYAGIKVMPTFHPAYLLRNPEQKRLVWDDIKKMMALLGIAQ